jgi:hypothetical protein
MNADEHGDLLRIEAAEERRRLVEKGYRLEPKDLSRRLRLRQATNRQ